MLPISDTDISISRELVIICVNVVIVILSAWLARQRERYGVKPNPKSTVATPKTAKLSNLLADDHNPPAPSYAIPIRTTA